MFCKVRNSAGNVARFMFYCRKTWFNFYVSTNSTLKTRKTMNDCQIIFICMILTTGRILRQHKNVVILDWILGSVYNNRQLFYASLLSMMSILHVIVKKYILKCVVNVSIMISFIIIGIFALKK